MDLRGAATGLVTAALVGCAMGSYQTFPAADSAAQRGYAFVIAGAVSHKQLARLEYVTCGGNAMPQEQINKWSRQAGMRIPAAVECLVGYKHSDPRARNWNGGVASVVAEAGHCYGPTHWRQEWLRPDDSLGIGFLEIKAGDEMWPTCKKMMEAFQ